MLSLCTVVKVTSGYEFCPSGDPQVELMASLGDDYENVISYKEANLFGFVFIKPILADINSIKLVDFEGTPERKLNQAITYLKRYSYVESQADPTKLDQLESGNCQAISLALKAIMLHNGVSAGTVYGEDHMYNWVQIDGSRYLVDVVNGYMKEG